MVLFKTQNCYNALQIRTHQQVRQATSKHLGPELEAYESIDGAEEQGNKYIQYLKTNFPTGKP